MDDEQLLSASTPEAKIEYLKMKDDYNSYLPQEMPLANLRPIDEQVAFSTTEAVAMANKEMSQGNLSPIDEEMALSTSESVAMANKEMSLANLSPIDEEIALLTIDAVAMANKVFT